jgi:glycosyltransferase involved in cell wall biosynthesis
MSSSGSSSSPLASFVVPCYNYGRFLPDCLNSIFGQEGDYPIEIIAIDDASSDNTLEVLNQYQDPRLRVIRHAKNEGHVRTISQGLQEARGRFVARIDPDDRYRSCFLSEAIPRLQQHPEVGLVYGDAALIDAEGKVNAEHTDRSHRSQDFKGSELIALLIENIICAPTVMARREAWVNTLPVPPDLAFSDWYFSLMIARKYEFVYVNRVLADYRVHSSNHHVKVVQNRSEEPSIMLLLDRIFSESESDSGLEKAKQAARGKVYATQYLSLATKYFGCGMMGDARRCYLNTIRHFPRHALSMTLLRRLLATGIDQPTYTNLKRLLRPGL